MVHAGSGIAGVRTTDDSLHVPTAFLSTILRPFCYQTWDIPSYYFRGNTINSCADVPPLLHLVRSEIAVAFFLATTFISKLLVELPVYPTYLKFPESLNTFVIYLRLSMSKMTRNAKAVKLFSD